ncbi:integral membrane protein S linking to the trans Golgi network-domain-containing protein [Sparassis latifolia]
MAKTSGWDPVLLISQIVSMQSLHYLTLAVLVPPLLTIFAEPSALEYDGGAANVGMVMDWREMAGRLTARTGDDPWSTWNAVWSGGKQLGSTIPHMDDWDGRIDPARGWIIAVCWLVASAVDVYYLYALIRRPRLILDFSLTLIFNHLVLTTYYSKSLPTSLFFWAIMFSSAALMVITAEQLCVKREMAEGLAVAPSNEGEELEMGDLLRRD